jgi:hypothetical protein
MEGDGCSTADGDWDNCRFSDITNLCRSNYIKMADILRNVYGLDKKYVCLDIRQVGGHCNWCHEGLTVIEQSSSYS